VDVFLAADTRHPFNPRHPTPPAKSAAKKELTIFKFRQAVPSYAPSPFRREMGAAEVTREPSGVGCHGGGSRARDPRSDERGYDEINAAR